MTNEENKANMMEMAEQTLKAGKEFLPRILLKTQGDWRNYDDERVTQQAMACHFFLALRMLECLLMLRGSDLGFPARVMFRTLGEIITRGIWIARPDCRQDRAARARSYFDYAEMKRGEMDKQMQFVRDFVGDKGTEETVRAALRAYREKGGAKSESRIREDVKCQYGDNACTIHYSRMLEEIDFVSDYATVYAMASAAIHGIPTAFDTDVPGHVIVADHIDTAADRFYVLAHRTAMAFGVADEELNSAFRAAIQAREKKAEQDKQRMRS